MKPYFKVYALMFIVDVALTGFLSWFATIPLNSLWTFAPLAAVMFSLAAFVSYKLQLRGVWWLVISLMICDVFITIQFSILAAGKMSVVDVFRGIHQERITFYLTLLPELIAHVAGLFAWIAFKPSAISNQDK
jgi:hypothetical protein